MRVLHLEARGGCHYSTSLLGHTDTAVSGRTPVRTCPPRPPPTGPAVTSSVSPEAPPARPRAAPRLPAEATCPVLARRGSPVQSLFAEISGLMLRSPTYSVVRAG